MNRQTREAVVVGRSVSTANAPQEISPGAALSILYIELATLSGLAESVQLHALSTLNDAGGGTRTPDTRIMIGVNC